MKFLDEIVDTTLKFSEGNKQSVDFIVKEFISESCFETRFLWKLKLIIQAANTKDLE